jgi:raffinose/stachyose/melibiose transport system permease protein
VPLFAIWYHLGLVDTLQGIILIYSAIYMPFGIFLLRSYFVGLPPELSDAALVDGCSDFGVFARIVMPLSWPAFGSVGLIIGVWTWNEFIFAVTFLHTDQSETVAVRFNSFVGQYVSNYAYMAAAGVIMILPAVLAFLSLQRRFIAGLTSGALKT